MEKSIFCFLLFPFLVSCNPYQGNSGSFIDQRDDMKYGWVRIGKQIWMAQNLNSDHFRNGDSIPQAKTPEEWSNANRNQQPAWCYFGNQGELGNSNGKLYNWYAVDDPRGIAPKNWHVPTDSEWKELSVFLGMSAGDAEKLHERGRDEGEKMKDPKDPRWNISADSAGFFIGFNARTTGLRFENGTFGYDSCSFYYTSSKTTENKVFAYGIHQAPYLNRCEDPKTFGFSIRCIRDR